jgi:hypothetical protein
MKYESYKNLHAIKIKRLNSATLNELFDFRWEYLMIDVDVMFYFSGGITNYKKVLLIGNLWLDLRLEISIFFCWISSGL